MLERFFDITGRGSTVSREVRGGVVTFFTMAYIVVLNPLILSRATDIDGQYLGGGAEPNVAAIAAGTALVAGVMTIAMGAIANFPLALATGLGLNAFVAFSLASQMTWAQAMGLVVIEGLIILLLVLTGVRQAVFNAVPAELKIAISVGIGLFITLIGLVDAGFVRRTGTGPVPVELGIGGTLAGWPVAVFAFGVLLVAALWVRKVKGAILIAIATTTVVAFVVEKVFSVGSAFPADGPPNPRGWGLVVPTLPDAVVEAPDFGTLGQVDLLGAFGQVGLVVAALLVFSLLLADFFDTVGTMTAVGAEADLLDDTGAPPKAQRILIVDSVAAVAGGAAGVSSNTSYIESASGVGEGARTGLASIVTGVLFLLTIFFSPLLTAIPYEAATPALVLVGFLMIQQVDGIDWKDPGIGIPAFLTIVLMPFTYSIAVGIGAGIVSYVLLAAVRGAARTVHPLMWVTAVLFGIYFAVEPLTAILT